jgi:HAD superfamily hydrolase (TIGR01509 family)
VKPALAQAIEDCGPLLLDFDGPVCSIFAGYTNAEVSSELRKILSQRGAHLPSFVLNESDPLEVLRWTATLAESALTQAAEDALRAAEVNAVSTAVPTPGVREVLWTAKDTGRRVAIVSNNSAPAIAVYLDLHELSEYIAHIVGREPYAPERMKPNPYPVTRAIAALDVKPEKCILIGDSVSDIRAAQAVGVAVIGYANKPPKAEQFKKAGADHVVTTMAEIAAELMGV